ncbi:bifunctional aminoglycoside phosphotransferase/ATP-binding protein [Thiomicrorhabdus sp. Kp2]|uniref:bifunctional aminoglycoside phosphotransferase/ATP-binding protein n=1 Tax=Thiomicrorhabdus sp. Kp2 TaxID=1123518 RepID=UPI0003FF5567|nr:bifunctional aminoglycoside phosphotransferase/ATP-binding protein [Thiomicrorhabdus sp. Kp2]
MNTANLIDILLNPETYPHPVEVITTIETHISIVFLTGQYAYKLKKNVDFGFLDFSSLEKRQKFCFLEVELNRRTAPNLYIGVTKLCINNFSATLKPHNHPEDEHSRLQNTHVEYLVKMRQFDPNMVLGRLLKQGVLDFKLVEKLSKQIAQFHKTAHPVNPDENYGNPEIQLQPMLDNFPTLNDYFHEPKIQHDLSLLLEWTNTQYKQLYKLLTQRKKEGFIRACHGDLHLDNITLIEEQPVLFDGIEFNEYFRWIDVFSDLAFLLIDLEFKHQQACSYKLLSLYLSQTLDYNGLKILNFYRVYRTLVRAKITALRAQQLPSDNYEKKQVEQVARQYIQQAFAYIEKPPQPKCLLLQGVSGSGKSYFANQLLDELDDFNALIISSDRIRKSLFGIAASDRVSEDQKRSLYSPEMNQKTYQAMNDFAAMALKQGFNVIIDATFLKYEHRQKFYKMAKQSKSSPYLFSINVTESKASEAILNRQQLEDNPSDASIDIMINQRKQLEPPELDENAITLLSEELRQQFPKQIIQEFLNLAD